MDCSQKLLQMAGSCPARATVIGHWEEASTFCCQAMSRSFHSSLGVPKPTFSFSHGTC